ncbi:MAG: tetratricopeptide repeat protein [Chloroflexota bacterium]|nr:MAG: hypothetical protein DIU68_01035 [Chloroflexota bacterium]
MADFTSHEAPVHEAQSLPATLPSKLIGRDMVLATIYTHLKDNMPVQIYGPAGIGKTALAATLASAYTELPGGVLWMHVRQPELEDLLVRVGRAYGIPEIANRENPRAMIGAVAHTLTANKPLIVIDGTIDAAVAQEFITRCADNLPALILSDEQLVGPWTPISLSRLEPGQAALLFRQVAGLENPDSEEHDADIDNLVERLNFNPFALVVAAATVRANQQSPLDFLNAMPQQPGVAGPLLALTTAFRTLNSAMQGLVLMMGATFTGEASAELLSMVSSAPQESIERAMEILARRGLLERFQRYGSSYYRLHPITYTFTQPLLRGSNKLDPLRTKVRDTLVAYARKHSNASADAYNRLAAEMDSLLAAARWSTEQGDQDTANQLTVALMQAGDFVNARGYVYELMSLRRLATSSTSAFPAHASETSAPLPYEDVRAGEQSPPASDEPEDEEASEPEAAEESPTATTAVTTSDAPLPPVAPLLGSDEEEDDLDLEEEEDEEAEDAFYPTLPYDLLGEDEEDEFEDEDIDEAETATVAETTDEMTEPEAPADKEAEGEPTPPSPEPPEVARLRASLAQARQQGNLHRQSELLSQIGQAFVQANMENEAIASFSEALATYEEMEDRSGMLRTLETLASLTARTDNLQAAVLHASRGVQIAQQTGDTARQMRLLSILGDARQQLGESDQAVSAYTLALDLARQLQNSEEEAQLLMQLGYALLDDGRPQDAIKQWDQALALFREQGKRDCEGRVLGGLGTAYGELSHWTEAIAFHTSALYIAREVGDKEEEALQLRNLGDASLQAQQLGQAVLRYRQALHLAIQANNRDNIVSLLVDLANLLAESRRHLKIAELLADEAMRLDPTNRNVRRLKERVEDELEAAEASGVQLAPVTGTVQEYAANAYQLLDA